VKTTFKADDFIFNKKNLNLPQKKNSVNEEQAVCVVSRMWTVSAPHGYVPAHSYFLSVPITWNGETGQLSRYSDEAAGWTTEESGLDPG
jgi:hypothetical protein